MKKEILCAGLACLAVCVSSCGRRGGGAHAGAAETRDFPQVTVPAVIETVEERAEYVALHCLDQLTRPRTAEDVRYLCDSFHVEGVPEAQVEQAVANWCGFLDMVPLETAEKASARLFSRLEACESADTSSNVFEAVGEMVDIYLYDPNSPLRNEDFYRPFVLARSKSPLVSPSGREAAAETARRCALNKVGTRAADFRFSDRSGHMHTLYGIRAERTLLFFSNPGCNACKEIIDALKSYPEMEKMIASGELAVLNIYIDEDMREWYEYMPVYPVSWHNGFDPDCAIRNELLYDVRAIPSLYLLGRDKTVLMKDAPVEKVLPAVFGH